MIRIKRTYERPSREDGYRVLVDRLWPRGLSKVKAGVDLWLKEIAPSERLRKGFSHDPQKWESFRMKYGLGLREKEGLVGNDWRLEKEKGAVALKNVLTNNVHTKKKE